jgi:hypothetical protein
LMRLKQPTTPQNNYYFDDLYYFDIVFIKIIESM